MITSGLSKLFALGLQALAIPLVYRALGQHRYQLYLLLSAALGTLAITQLGAGPGLTQGIAKASAGGDRVREGRLLSAAFRVVGSTATLGALAILIAVHLVAPDTLFGPGFDGDRAEIIHVINTCVIVLMAQMIFGVVDSALAGYQEQMFSNIGAMFSNMLSIAALVAVCLWHPTIDAVILAMFGLPSLSRVLNFFSLMRRRPYLARELTASCRGLYGSLFSVGMAFWAMQVGGILEQNGGTYLLSHLSSSAGTNLFAMVYKTLALSGAVVTILTTPLWPAFTDAIAHRDLGWIHRAYRKIRRLLTLYSVGVAVLLALAGRPVFEHLVHANVDIEYSHLMFVVLGAYFIANIWTHLFYVTMMGMSGIWKIAAVALAENVLMLAFGALLTPVFGATGMALAYLAASVVLPVWLLPRLFDKNIAELSAMAAKA